jgi:organic hydroperoxide reductase OsmC/OhrA
MSEHQATIQWKRESPDFKYETYNRSHQWRFDSGVEVPASAAPGYQGDPERVDPEEAMVAAMSSCHMLTFLALSAKKKFVVEEYTDEAVGYLEKNDKGKLAITRAILRPKVRFADSASPSEGDLAQLHERAHEHCFIANSVCANITVEPQ